VVVVIDALIIAFDGDRTNHQALSRGIFRDHAFFAGP
jgi:hypothetical protein